MVLAHAPGVSAVFLQRLQPKNIATLVSPTLSASESGAAPSGHLPAGLIAGAHNARHLLSMPTNQAYAKRAGVNHRRTTGDR